jgi:hypothetical protein
MKLTDHSGCRVDDRVEGDSDVERPRKHLKLIIYLKQVPSNIFLPFQYCENLRRLFGK